METTYKWIVLAMDCAPSEDGLNDVVKTVHYRRQATAVDGDNTYVVELYGAMGCAAPDPMAFTPYEQLTYEDVCAWLDSNLDVQGFDIALDGQIEAKINPPIVQLPIPWQEVNNSQSAI